MAQYDDDFQSKYEGAQIETILDESFNKLYKVNLEVVPMESKGHSGATERNGTVPCVRIYGLPKEAVASDYTLRLYRRGHFKRSVRYEFNGHDLTDNFAQRGWIHPRHLQPHVLAVGTGQFIPPYPYTMDKDRREILSEFKVLDITGGQLEWLDADNNQHVANNWSEILGGFGGWFYNNENKQVEFTYKIGKSKWYVNRILTSTPENEKPHYCVFSRPFRNRFGLALFKGNTRISPIVPFDVSIGMNVYNNNLSDNSAYLSIGLV